MSRRTSRSPPTPPDFKVSLCHVELRAPLQTPPDFKVSPCHVELRAPLRPRRTSRSPQVTSNSPRKKKKKTGNRKSKKSKKSENLKTEKNRKIWKPKKSMKIMKNHEKVMKSHEKSWFFKNLKILFFRWNFMKSQNFHFLTQNGSNFFSSNFFCSEKYFV